jgi:hypothetical protein
MRIHPLSVHWARQYQARETAIIAPIQMKPSCVTEIGSL